MGEGVREAGGIKETDSAVHGREEETERKKKGIAEEGKERSKRHRRKRKKGGKAGVGEEQEHEILCI